MAARYYNTAISTMKCIETSGIEGKPKQQRIHISQQKQPHKGMNRIQQK